MPYDRFTTLQLAGDLLPGGDPGQRLATAFHRNTLTNDEGGTDDEEFRIAAVKDRVDTTVQVWMGLTMGCAKCHTHKYDPISNREYYQFYAFFNQTEDSDRYDDGPAESFPTALQQARIQELRRRIEAIEGAMFEPTPEHLAAVTRWERSQSAETAWTVLKPGRMTAASGSRLAVQPDGSIKVEGAAPPRESYRLECEVPAEQITGLRLEALPDPSLPRGGSGRSPGDGNFVLSGLSITLEASNGQKRDLLPQRAEADFAQDGYPIEHVLRNPDVNKKHGWAVAPRQGEGHQALFLLAQPVRSAPGSRLVVRLDHQFEYSYPGFSMGRFRIAITGDRNPKLASTLPPAIAEILKLPAERRTREQSTRLLRHYLESTSEVKAGRGEQSRLKAEIDTILASSRTPIYRELPAGKQRVTRVHRRGNFLDQGESVDPATPSYFPPMPREAPRNRLGVALWLLDPDNPLTARVAVNRHWAQFFGRGLVETQEDFGAARAAAQPSGIARLAGLRVPRRRLVDETALPADRDVGNLSAIVPCHAGAAPQRQGQPLAGAGAQVPPRGRDDPRQRAADRGAAQRQDARPVGHAASTRWHLAQHVQHRSVELEPWRGPLSPGPLHLHQTHLALPRAHHVRRAQPRSVHGPPDQHQHSLAGSGHAERSGLCRGCKPWPGA